jgi:ribosomal protein S4
VSSIFEARQLINHKNILINNNIVDKRSVTLNYHDILTIDYKVVNKLINNLIFRINTEGILFRPPVYIEVNYKKYMVIFLFDIIKANQIPFNFKITGLDINTILYYYY